MNRVQKVQDSADTERDEMSNDDDDDDDSERRLQKVKVNRNIK